jgi:hypothetical protein
VECVDQRLVSIGVVALDVQQLREDGRPPRNGDVGIVTGTRTGKNLQVNRVLIAAVKLLPPHPKMQVLPRFAAIFNRIVRKSVVDMGKIDCYQIRSNDSRRTFGAVPCRHRRKSALPRLR